MRSVHSPPNWKKRNNDQHRPEVEIRFIAESAQSTRIELEHRLLERMGDRSAQVRTMIDSPGGWGLLLEAFKKSTDTRGDYDVGI
jgi:hypothetical protein